MQKQLTRGLTQNIQTPLIIVKQAVDFLIDAENKNNESPESNPLFKQIQSSLIKMISMVNDYLDLECLSNDDFKIKAEQFNVKQVLYQVFEDYI